MSDYSRIVDEGGNLCGLWLADTESAKDKLEVVMLLLHVGAPKDLALEVELGNYRVVPNRFDNKGGCFVVIGSAPAPGEV